MAKILGHETLLCAICKTKHIYAKVMDDYFCKKCINDEKLIMIKLIDDNYDLTSVILIQNLKNGENND